MQNTTDIDFITGDQPVINIYSVRKKPHEKVRRLEFYHPLTPRIAMRLSCDQAVDEIKTIDSRSEIIKFNSMIRSESLEQIYSMRRNEIEPINQ